jgi:ubiquinone/menaquinone biosynthesis C-methylase UbiE
LNDGGGVALIEWLKRHHPTFKPTRVLDLGCGLGHNTLPVAQAFPEAQVTAIDVAAPMLRYGHARAKTLGVSNVEFRQANVESLDYPDGHFDLIFSTMFLHETSFKAMPKVLAETRRLLAPKGLSVHLEQPQYTDEMDVYEQFIRDWDAYNNNEPFWTTMHELDLKQIALGIGHAPDEVFESGAAAALDPQLFPAAANAASQQSTEDYGRKAAWYAFGTRAA